MGGINELADGGDSVILSGLLKVSGGIGFSKSFTRKNSIFCSLMGN